MAPPEIPVQATLNQGDFQKGIKAMQKNLKQFNVITKKSSLSTINFAAKLDIAVKAFRGFNIVARAGGRVIGDIITTAADFQTAFTGVKKVLEGTDKEFKKLRSDILELSKVIPIPAVELAKIAENAGRLGIATKDVTKFTEVIAKLADATELTSEEAATDLARITSILPIVEGDISNLGSAIVDLGNSFAASEPEIVAFATRIAAAGKQVNLRTEDLIAFGAAFAALGVQAEAGGTAISKTFTAIGDAVIQGGKELRIFAEVAGLTISEFRKLFEKDAAFATLKFIEGLQGITEEGRSVTPILEDLGLASERTRRALLSAAGGGDILRRALEQARSAFKENTALTKEFEARLKTFDSQWRLTQNAIDAVKVELGAKLLPVLTDVLVKGIQPLIKELGNLDVASKSAISQEFLDALITMTGLLQIVIVTASALRKVFVLLGSGVELTIRGMIALLIGFAFIIQEAFLAIPKAILLAFAVATRLISDKIKTIRAGLGFLSAIPGISALSATLGVAGAAFDKVTNKTGDLIGKFKTLGIEQETVKDAFKKGIAAVDGLVIVLGKNDDAVDKSIGSLERLIDAFEKLKAEAAAPPTAPPGGETPKPGTAKTGIIDTTGIEDAKNKVLSFFNDLFGLRQKSTQQFSQEQQQELNILQDTLKKKSQENQLNTEESVQLLREAFTAGIIDQEKFNEGVKILRKEDIENQRLASLTKVQIVDEELKRELQIFKDATEANLIDLEDRETRKQEIIDRFRILRKEAELEDAEIKKAEQDLESENTALFLEGIESKFQLFTDRVKTLGAASAKALGQVFGNAFSGVQKAITKTVVVALKGGKQMSQAWKAVGESILNSIVGALVQIITEFIAFNIIQAIFRKKEVVSTGTAEAAKGGAAGFASVIKALPFPANVIAAPVVAAGIIAAIGAISAAGLAGLQKGADFIPGDGLQFLHAGERVVPAESNKDLRDFLAREAEGETGGFGGGGVIVNVEIESFSGSEDEAQRLAEIVSEQVELRSFEFGRA